MANELSSVHYSWFPTTAGYDAFLNHRGADVKDSLGSLIFRNLQNKGLKVFFYKNSIQVGENIPQSIEKAIHSASVYLVIFSPRYAESVWCLKELQLIQKTRTPIIPVFCEIRLSNLRTEDEEGVYARAFRKHTGKFESHLLEEWKQALSEVSYIKGYVFEGDQGLMLEKIATSLDQFICRAKFQPKQGTAEMRQRNCGLP